MGLTDITYLYSRREGMIASTFEDLPDLEQVSKDQFVIRDNEDYWIDLLIMEPRVLSIRVALCNPFETLFPRLIQLFDSLISQGGGVRDEFDKKNYKQINEESIATIKDSYLRKFSTFKEMYPDIVAAISSDDLHKYAK